jgi:DNA-binding CsgD family transcriptional regulator
MPKRNAKPRAGQHKGKPPRTVAEYLARAPRQRESMIKTAHVLTAMRTEGLSLRKAARELGVSPSTVQRYAGSALRKSSRGTYKARVSDGVLRVLVIPTPSGLVEVAVRDSRTASIVGEYANAAQAFLQTGDDSELRTFRAQHIMDAEGNQVPLLTDTDELERLGSAGVLSFESLYARAS